MTVSTRDREVRAADMVEAAAVTAATTAAEVRAFISPGWASS